MYGSEKVNCLLIRYNGVLFRYMPNGQLFRYNGLLFRYNVLLD